jgi:hypothetical protein
VDLIVERADGRVVAIEVKLARDIGDDDGRGGRGREVEVLGQVPEANGSTPTCRSADRRFPFADAVGEAAPAFHRCGRGQAALAARPAQPEPAGSRRSRAEIDQARAEGRAVLTH